MMTLFDAPPPPTSEAACPGGIRRLTTLVTVCLAMATAASIVLTQVHLKGLTAPGCGQNGGCSRLLAGAWAKLPLVEWPLAFLGVAYFPAILVAWYVTRGRFGEGLRGITWVAGIASIILVGVMVVTRSFCPWCLTVHAANLTFLAATAGRGSGRSFRTGLTTFLITLIALTAGLAMTTAAQKANQLRRWDEGRSRFASAPSAPDDRTGLSGRYRMGPSEATVRIVIFFDYQCPICAEFERQATQLLRRFPNVSLSARHFPLNRACNPTIQGTADGLHANSCRAARVAEAAGILGGDRAFFAVHRWLFEHHGEVAAFESLRDVIAEVGLDPSRFLKEIGSNEVSRNIQADLQDAARLGLVSTPMVFVNGVELKTLGVEDALIKTVEAMIQSTSVDRSIAADPVQITRRNAVTTWADSPQVALPAPRPHGWRGSADAQVEVDVWGDYLDEETRRLDHWLRDRLRDAPSFRYRFRHAATATDSVVAAEAAEAGGRIGHAPGFWAVHAWLMSQPGKPDLVRLEEDLATSGIDRVRFVSALHSADVAVSVRDDGADAARLDPSLVLPLLYVNGRRVHQWRIGTAVVLDSILAAASDQHAHD